MSDWSATGGSNEGAFELCIEEYVPPSDICTNSPSTTSDCSGIIYDSGGVDGDYGPNENCILTITPNAFNQCIIANILSYDIENFGDELNFYDGPNTSSPLILSVNGVSANIEVQASSGSLTIEFISDGFVEAGGFEIQWECTPDECTVLSPIHVESNVSVDNLIDALSSPQVIVENPVLNCSEGAYGTYSSPGNTQLDIMGLPNGVVLSTGLVEDLENNENFFADTNLEFPGDDDLDSISLNDADLVNNALSNDACVLEFDVYAATDELEFQYVFGSEEYPSGDNPGFIGTQFNDIFAFLISGPGLANNTNIAILQDGITEVAVNTVNDGSVPGFGGPFDPVTGEVIYVNNIGGLSLPFGGYTSVLTARADVIPCNYYHLKLAIADRSDNAYDSGVFIGDLSAGLPQISVEFSISTVNGENILVEGCSNGSDVINATIENPNQDTFIYYIGVSGDADENLDLVNPIIDSLVAFPGTTTFEIPFEPIDDGLDEIVETLTLDLFAVFQCDTVTYNTIPILIYDEPDVTISQDTFYVCEGTSTLLGVSGATDYTWGWEPSSEIDNPNLISPTLTPSQSGTIYVSGIINGNNNCISTDSVYIQILDPTIISLVSPPFICEEESTQLSVLTNTNNSGISWSPALGLSCIDCPNPIASPTNSTIYTATVTAGGCTESINIEVTVVPLAIPDLVAPTEICEGNSITLASVSSGTGITTYTWTPNDGSLDDPTSGTPIATPNTTTTYTVIASSNNGGCTNSQSVTIDVFPATIEIDGPDTIYQCDSDLNTITLTASSILDPSEITWTDNAGNNLGTGSSIQVSPTQTTIYSAAIQNGNCINSDEVVVQIDSLNAFNLNVQVLTQGIDETNPDTISICSSPNESLFVLNSYDNTIYPNISHEWLANGLPINPPQNDANMVDNLPLAITTYYLLTENNACTSIDSFVVEVNAPEEFSITPSNSTICEGESVQLTASGISNITWIPNDGTLSSTNISNPIATPTQSTEYTAFTNNGGCQVGVSSIITVLEEPNINLPNELNICFGNTTQLGFDNYNPNYTYTWSPNNSIIAGEDTGNPLVAPTANTTYSVTVSNQGFCEIQESITVNVSQEGLPLDLSGSTTICNGESASLSAITQGAVTWYDANDAVIGSGADIMITPTGIGTYEYVVIAESNECSTTLPFIINVVETPTLITEGDEICLGETAQISATTDIGNILWTPEEEFTNPSSSSQSTNPNATTTYVVSVDNNGCIVEEEVVVSLLPSPIFELISNVTICPGDEVSLGNITDPSTTYVWSPNAGIVSGADTGTPLVSPTSSTTYTLTATNEECTVSDSVNVIITNLGLTSSNLTICEGDTATFNASLSGGEIVWTDWEGNTMETGNTFDISPPVTTSYTVTQFLGQCAVSEIVTVNVIPSNSVGISSDLGIEITAGQSVNLTATDLVPGSDYEWSSQEGELIPGDESITVTPSQTTTYFLNGTTPDGCPFNVSITIIVLSDEAQMPNVFTPNGDEVNDTFYPANATGLEILEFKIFDRWGEVVHEDITSPWDGNFGGKDLPSDIYLWVLKTRNVNGDEKTQKGDVALLR